jgi:hypothetical protein
MEMEFDTDKNCSENDVGFIEEDQLECPVHAGPGACSARGCNCGGFRPTGLKNDVCAYCGHMWAIHR